MAGVRVDTAGDGTDALGYLNTHSRPDVILLDMGMPRCDGPTAVRAIRQDPAYAGVKIVAVTGHLPGEYDLPVGPLGVDCWVHKPVDPVALVREFEARRGVSAIQARGRRESSAGRALSNASGSTPSATRKSPC